MLPQPAAPRPLGGTAPVVSRLGADHAAGPPEPCHALAAVGRFEGCQRHCIGSASSQGDGPGYSSDERNEEEDVIPGPKGADLWRRWHELDGGLGEHAGAPLGRGAQAGPSGWRKKRSEAIRVRKAMKRAESCASRTTSASVTTRQRAPSAWRLDTSGLRARECGPVQRGRSPGRWESESGSRSPSGGGSGSEAGKPVGLVMKVVNTFITLESTGAATRRRNSAPPVPHRGETLDDDSPRPAEGAGGAAECWRVDCSVRRAAWPPARRSRPLGALRPSGCASSSQSVVCASEVIVEAQGSERERALQLAAVTADQTVTLSSVALAERPRVPGALGRMPALQVCEAAPALAAIDDGAAEDFSSTPGYEGSPRVSLGACGSAAEAVEDGVVHVIGAAIDTTARQGQEEKPLACAVPRTRLQRHSGVGPVLAIRGLVDIEELTVAEHQDIVEELMETCGSGGRVRGVLLLTGPMADALGGRLLAGDAVLRCADGASAQQVLSQYGHRKFDGRAVRFICVDPGLEDLLITVMDNVAAPCS